MAKARLTESEIERVEGLLVAWAGPLTWDLLVEQVQVILKRPFTRQGLDKQERIRTAYKLAKDRQRKSPAAPTAREMSVELAAALGRIERLEAEVKLLRAQRNAFDERFATWQYNARTRGISEADLNRPLPAVDRNGSKKKR